MKRVDFLCVLAAGLFLGLSGGVPYFHPDFLLDEAIAVLRQAGNPGFFWYPALMFYLMAGLYGGVFLYGRISGRIQSPGEIAALFPSKEAHYLPGHLLVVLLAVAGAWCAALMAWRLTRRRLFGLLGAFFVLTSLLWVRNAHYLTTDVPLATFCILTLYAVMRAGARAAPFRGREVILIGLLFGAVVATKYNGAVLFVPLALALFLYYRAPRRTVRDLVRIGGVAAVFFVICNPYLFIHFKTFLEQFQNAFSELTGGKLGFYASRGWWFHLTDSFVPGYGALPFGLALAGLVILLRASDIPPGDRAAAIAFPLFFYLVMGREKAAFTRHILPVIPFLGVFSAAGIWGLHQQVRRLFSKPFPAALLAGLIGFAVMIPQVALSIRHNQLLAAGDTRRDLREVLRACGGMPDLVVYTGYYGKRDVHGSRIPTRAHLASPTEFQTPKDPIHGLFRKPVDLAILDSFSHDRLLAGPGEEPPPVAEGFDDWHVFQLSPYRAPKDRVPVSPESIYSPYPPDLSFRDRAGPFIELYGRGGELKEKLLAAFRKRGVSLSEAAGTNGYYFTRIGARIAIR